MFRLLSVALLFTSLAGCASGPIKFEEPAESLTVPKIRQAIASQEESPWELNGERVLWGGTVLSVTNLPEATQIEVIAYPLDRRQRPMTGRDAQGRFVAYFEGFVEPLNFPNGRAVTLSGTIIDPVSGSVGAASYEYPAIEVIDSHLWSPEELRARSGVTFGIGINLSN